MAGLLYELKKFVPRRIFLFWEGPYHFLLSFWSALFYGFPSRRIFVVGVTGTKGKTTVVELLHEILTEAGQKTASVSSLRFKVGSQETKNNLKMTMPGRMFLQRFLHEAVKNKCTYAVLEVTSEGIRQYRHRFIGFQAAVMTNVAPEHIEAHGSFEKYLRAKLDLFWRLPPGGIAIINRDDPNAERFSAASSGQKVFYGKSGITLAGDTQLIKNMEFGEKISFDVNQHAIYSYLKGEFNFYNICAALAFGLSIHIALERIAQGVAKVAQIPGRMEYLQKEPFAAVVDYAHTPHSLRQVYRTIKESIINDKLYPERKLICVLGSAGGGRDKWKRPELGKIAARFCSDIVLTNEDPYDEDPEKILQDIASGIPHELKVTREIDRRAAIRLALKKAEAGDTVVITGKGAESWIMGPQGTKAPWDDREVAREELVNLDHHGKF